MTTNLRAALTVCDYATSPDEARELLDMLGLISGGNITDDFTRVIELDRPDAKGPGARSLYSLQDRGDVKPHNSTAPAALRHMPAPVVVKQENPGTKNLLAASEARKKPCGTLAAKKRHRRNGEDCAVCDPVTLTDPLGAQRKREARRKKGISPRALQPCGTEAANKRHKANGEPVCDECKRARNEAEQRRKAAKRVAA